MTSIFRAPYLQESRRIRLDRAAHRPQGLAAFIGRITEDDGEGHSVPTHGVFIEDGTRTYSDLGLFDRAHGYWCEFFKRYGVG
jgi:hypothetical protein